MKTNFISKIYSQPHLLRRPAKVLRGKKREPFLDLSDKLIQMVNS
jgi:hypothetical protein